jgi:hypothetical protein
VSLRAAILLAALGLGLSGCGGNSTSSNPQTNSTSRVTTAVVPGPASDGGPVTETTR